MTITQALHEKIKQKAYELRLPFIEIPKYIRENLKYDFFAWQKEAFENLLIYNQIKEKENPDSETHLMFNLATGTGKTMLMASTILYYYSRGYRHFIFFVNQNNIIDKTEENFLNHNHPKYLFREKIVIDDQTIHIKKVENFSDNPQNIEIKFTSIHKLYNDIHLEKENKTTLSDLHEKKIIMLADEAHHLNALTKAQDISQTELLPTELKGNTNEKDIEKKGWEHTVIDLILKKNGENGKNENVLLEFTATVPANKYVQEKYNDKIIAKFDLKEFLDAGYTKEINLISSTLDKKERILQALIFNWYRHKIALKNGISNFKAVILFRSKTIKESEEDFEFFAHLIKNLEIKDFDFLKNIENIINEGKEIYEQGKSKTRDLLKFIENEKINLSEVVGFMQTNFGDKNCIITNSKDNKTKKEKTNEDQEKLLNNLEDKNNHIRAIFTVDRLTEGWDVLNLFDIVRLYQGQNAGGSDKKTPQSTTKEIQLIGRGVRYFPFSYQEIPRNKRKFDKDLKNEMRILEELFYYTYDEESRYISHLKTELREMGLLPENEKISKTFDLKKEFKESDFYKNVKVWQNNRKENPERKKKNLNRIKKDFSFEYKIEKFEATETRELFDKKTDHEEKIRDNKNTKTLMIKFAKIEKNIFQKAINIKGKQGKNLFHFENIRQELNIESIDDLQKEEFFGDFEIKIISQNEEYEDIENKEKLNLTLKFLEKSFAELKEHINPYIGSDFESKNFAKIFTEAKTKVVNKQEDKEVVENSWYVLDSFVGTDEEKTLIEFIKNSMGNLEEKYKEIYLLRNEEVYKIFDFEKGRGFMPDFILFLKSKDKQKTEIAETEIYYQIFIEPKGEHILSNEDSKWKEDFLNQISEKYGLEKVIKVENPNYRLIGLPLFNNNKKKYFEEKFKELV